MRNIEKRNSFKMLLVGAVLSLFIIISFVCSSEAQVPVYTQYTGNDYQSILNSAKNGKIITEAEYSNRIIVLSEARKMATVIWTSPVTFYSWKGSEQSYNSNKSMLYSGKASGNFVFEKDCRYVGIPYAANAGYNQYNVDSWFSLINSSFNASTYEGTVNYLNISRKDCTFRGIDCSGFVYNAYKKLESYKAGYLSTSGLLSSSSWAKITEASALPGDILLKSGHVMIYVGKTSDNRYSVMESVADGPNGFSGCRCYTFGSVSGYGFYKYKDIAKENSSGRITIRSDIPEIYVDETNGFSWSVTGTLKRENVKWQSSNASVLRVDNNGSIQGISAGTATVTAYAEYDGKRICEASKTVKVLNRINLAAVSVSLSTTSYEYSGYAKQPSVKASYQGKNLTKGRDYTVSYSENVNVGKATAKITGTGRYTGSVTRQFKIKPYFKLSNSSITLYLKGTKKKELTATVKTGGKKTPKVTWKSSNKKIASVSSKGLVTGKKEGKATITATIKTSVGTFSKKCTVTVKKGSSSGGGCVTPDTLISLADGSQKRVDELADTDILKAYDFDEGMVVDAPMTLLHRVEEEAPVLRVLFSDGTEIGVVKDHCFFDLTDRCFVLIESEEQADDLKGHLFAVLNGNSISETELTDITEKGMTESYYAPVSEIHLNCFANGLMNMPGYISGFCNIFELEDSELKYKTAEKTAEINEALEKMPDEFGDIMNLDVFQRNRLEWIAVSVERGIITEDDLNSLYEFCLPFFTK